MRRKETLSALSRQAVNHSSNSVWGGRLSGSNSLSAFNSIAFRAQDGPDNNFQQLLKEQSINPDITEKGEGSYDGASFYGRIDQVLGLAVEALLKDGIDREGVMMLFASNAVKALYKGVKLTEARKRKNEGLLQSAAITLPKKYGG